MSGVLVALISALAPMAAVAVSYMAQKGQLRRTERNTDGHLRAMTHELAETRRALELLRAASRRESE